MRRRDFTLLWSASATSQLGNICSTTANPLLALFLTHSPIFAGLVGAASTVPSLLMYLPAGWFVDRFNRRLLMFIGQVGRFVAATALVYALWAGQCPTVVIVVAALFEGTFLVLYNAAEITAVQHVVNAEELPSALALNEARVHVAVIAGKPLGGFLFECNRAFPYCMNVLVSIGSIFALLTMKERDFQPHARDKPATKISTFDAVKEVVLSPFLLTAVIVCTIGNFFFQTVVLLLMVLAEQQGMSGASIGLLLATSGVGGLIGSMIAPKVAKRFCSERNIIALCVGTWAVLTLVVAVSGNAGIGLAAWGGLSVTGAILNVAMITYQVERVSGHLLGRVMGIVRFVTSGAVPLGALMAGYLVSWLQPRGAALLAFTAIMLMACVVLVLGPTRLSFARVIRWLLRQTTRVISRTIHGLRRRPGGEAAPKRPPIEDAQSEFQEETPEDTSRGQTSLDQVRVSYPASGV
ncbi:MAG TPA: MFS transporter [Streptosporangiaceae bacterium]|nr:MFS transporter [Streptosporangiaceae bacterium]